MCTVVEQSKNLNKKPLNLWEWNEEGEIKRLFIKTYGFALLLV